ncbi:MAG: sulfite exporter TauE/SafE family protein [Halomonadaceae bacterium]|nr:MAG: sulfite exporter TauE/SafE family protein [Halomonadaceae bacterium]
MLTAVCTAMITSLFGVGGGLALLLVMALAIPPGALIPVHGLIQMGANASRAAMTWRHINGRVILAFLPGTLLGAWLGSLVLVRLPEQVWQLSIALFVLWMSWGPGLPKAAFGPVGIMLAAAFTGFASLFVGATGPLVAAFIKQIPQHRFATVATFASAMTLQHAPKAVLFGGLGFVLLDWLGFIALMILATVVGNRLGLMLLGRINDQRFHHLFNAILTLLALRLLWQAITGWLA